MYECNSIIFIKHIVKYTHEYCVYIYVSTFCTCMYCRLTFVYFFTFAYQKLFTSKEDMTDF